jgi:AbrB family looped-hinge helix DNA binding protein
VSLIQVGQELRRVQRLGGSSLVVTIPKQWARKIGLGPGDQVAVIDEGSALRIVPVSLSGGLAGRILRVRVNSIVERIGLERVVRCAYTLGYRGVRIEWNPRTVKLDLEKISGLLEESPSIESYRVGAGVIEVEFTPAHGDPSLHLRMLSSHILGALEGRVEAGPDGGLSVDDVYSNLIKAAAERVAANPQDLVALSLIMPLVDIALELARRRGLDGVAAKLQLLMTEVLGGASAGSLKRLVNALDMVDSLEAEARRGDTAAHGLLLALTIVVRRFLEANICQRLAE